MNTHGDLGPYDSDTVGWNKAQESDFFNKHPLEVVWRQHLRKYCKSEAPFCSCCVDCSSLPVVNQSPSAGDWLLRQIICLIHPFPWMPQQNQFYVRMIAMTSDLNSWFHYFVFHVLLLESAYIPNIRTIQRGLVVCRMKPKLLNQASPHPCLPWVFPRNALC